MTIILSPVLLKLYKLCSNIAYFTGSFPFKWCEEKDGVYYPKTSRFNPFQWNILKYVVFVNQVFITIRLVQSIVKMSPEKHISSIIPHFLYMTANLVPTAAQITLIHQGRALQTTTDQFIRFSKEFQGKLQCVQNGLIYQLHLHFLYLNFLRSIFSTWENQEASPMAKIGRIVSGRRHICSVVCNLIWSGIHCKTSKSTIFGDICISGNEQSWLEILLVDKINRNCNLFDSVHTCRYKRPSASSYWLNYHSCRHIYFGRA